MATRITVHASPLLLTRGVRGVAGQPMEIVMHLPTSPAFSALGFESGSACPDAQLLGSIPAMIRAARDAAAARLMLFGHADESGGDAYNKALSDRRAKVVFALLTQDLAKLDEVAHDDAWKLVQYQAIMAALAIDPMVVDGKPGPITTDGVRNFQEAYNEGAYHVRALRERARGRLAVDGVLGAKTEAALRDAYLARLDVQLDPARFFGPQIAGCGEFNLNGAPERDRRVVLALYRPDFPTESKIPCKDGDAGACKINRKSAHPWKCNFYRRTLSGETPLVSQELPMLGEITVQLDSPLVNPEGIRFIVDFDNGQTEEGTLDAFGKGRVRGDINVAYEVHFPDLTDDEWSV